MRIDDNLRLLSANPFPVAELQKLELPAPVITSARFEMTDGARCALMMARASVLAKQILPHWREMGGPNPTAADWAYLRNHNYVRMDRRLRMHVLLPRGLSAATAICSDLAKKFGIADPYGEERKRREDGLRRVLGETFARIERECGGNHVG